MIKRYYLNSNVIPTIPSMHDCIITKIDVSKEFLTLFFEDNISYHDFANEEYKKYKSLKIRYHLVDDFYTYQYSYSKIFGEKYKIIDNNKLVSFPKSCDMAYLYNYLSYQSIILKLWAGNSIVIDINCDYVEYEWEENLANA